MSVDKFGLGDRWPRPAQAAAGRLDQLPAHEWPELAARWLAAGYDSSLLRQLAKLRVARLEPGPSAQAGLVSWTSADGPNWSRDAADPAWMTRMSVTSQARNLMPAALRSIGFDPAPADDAFVARCQDALDIVQRDLDATGYGQYQFRASFGQEWPGTVFATLPDGLYWGGGDGMSREEQGSGLLVSAAYSVSSVLKEVPEVEWPVCAVHGGHPDAIWHGDDPVRLVRKAAWWRCTNTGHLLAQVGQLTAEVAKTLT